jgi:hypothetical protein
VVLVASGTPAEERISKIINSNYGYSGNEQKRAGVISIFVNGASMIFS